MLTLIPEQLGRYIQAHASPEKEIYKRLAEETRANTEKPQMMVGNVEGLFLRLLARISGARRVLEVGTFTGYSALAIAEALPDDGELITCDIDPDATAIARRHWDQTPLGGKIDLRLGPALETIAAIEGSLDMVFIDADKENYINYWDACVPKLRVGGFIVVDNVLWSGRVVDPTDEQDDETRAIVAFNDHVAADERVEHVMLSVRDGMTVAVRA